VGLIGLDLALALLVLFLVVLKVWGAETDEERAEEDLPSSTDSRD
jgi:hypothetical protein